MNILIFNIITLVSSIIIVGKYSKGEAVSGDIVILMVGMFILQLMFMFIGTAIAAVSKNPKTATVHIYSSAFNYVYTIYSNRHE